MRILFISIFLFTLVCTFACGQTASKTEQTNSKVEKAPSAHVFDLAEFEMNKEKWRSLAITNYDVTIEATGFLTNFPRPVLISVRNSKLVSIKSGDKKNNYVKGYDFLNTVEKLFTFVESEWKRKAEVLNVIYDDEFGFPKSIALDEKKGMSDDELGVTVTNFTPIK